jgi:hypothetical protein
MPSSSLHNPRRIIDTSDLAPNRYCPARPPEPWLDDVVRFAIVRKLNCCVYLPIWHTSKPTSNEIHKPNADGNATCSSVFLGKQVVNQNGKGDDGV